MATLTWQNAIGRPVVFTLPAGEISVGRDPSNAIRIDSPYISKRHAVLRRTAEGYTVTDLGSANGTLVNGREIKTALLSDGDRVEFGNEQLIFSGGVDIAEQKAPAPPSAGAAKRNPWVFRIVALTPVVLLLFIVMIGKMATSEPAPPAGTPAGTTQTQQPAPVAAVPEQASQSAPAAAPVGGAPTSTDPVPTAAPNATPAGAAAPPVITLIEIPADADAGTLYDMAQTHIKGGRLLEAYRYLQASVARDPKFEPSQHRLREVEATIQQVVGQHFAAAQRAASYLRFRDAIVEWEQVIGMTDPSDPRHQQALVGLAQARERLGLK